LAKAICLRYGAHVQIGTLRSGSLQITLSNAP
jgi:hypothetical protein